MGEKKGGRPKLVGTGIKLPREVVEWADREARRLGLSRASYIRMILLKAMAEAGEASGR